MTSCIDEKWESLTRYVRVNGNKIESLCGETKGSFYENGLIISKNENGYTVEDITSENREIKLSSFSEFDINGNLISGYVNCFELGHISIDIGYVQELFSGFIYNKNNCENWEWDIVV